MLAKKRSFLSCLALLLTLVMLLSQVSMLIACGGDEDTADSGNPPADSGSGAVVDDGVFDVEGVKYGAPVASAAFAESFDEFDIPAYSRLVSADGSSLTGRVGFAWNSEALLIALDFSSADRISVKVNNYSEAYVKEDLSDTGSAYIKVSFADAGVSPKDLGQNIPVCVVVESGEDKAYFDGYAKLADLDILYFADADDADDLSVVFNGKLGSPDNKENTAASGITFDGGIRMYDKFVSGSSNDHAQQKIVKKDIDALVDASGSIVFETELKIDSMPIYPIGFDTTSSAYGLSFGIGKDFGGDSIFFTIINTADGLSVVVYGESGTEITSRKLDRQVGDNFHLTVNWDGKDELQVFVDGKEILSVSNAGAERGGLASNSIMVIWQRSSSAALSSADDFDATFEYISLYSDSSTTILDTVDYASIFGTTNTTVSEHEDIYIAPQRPLVLPKTLSNEKYGFKDTEITWKSSDENIIALDGTITKPASKGEIVTVTASIMDGENVVSEKEFTFFVRASSTTGKVFRIKNDANPFTGAASTRLSDGIMKLDSGFTSVVYDMGKVTKINRATVNSYFDNIGLVNKNFYALYYSEDNVTYHYIENFSMLQTGNSISFYNFEVEARYLKLHNTLNNDYDETGRIVNTIQNIFLAEYVETPILADGEFGMEGTTKVKNDANEKVYDKIFSFKLSDIGVDTAHLKDDFSDIRFMIGKTVLPHFNAGSTFYIRVPVLEAKEEATVKFIYNNKLAQSVSDGNEVFEIQYGTKYGSEYSRNGWEHSLAVLPNGDLLSVLAVGSTTGYYRSTDGGFTWSKFTPLTDKNGTQVMSNAVLREGKNSKGGYDINLITGGGFIIDNKSGKIFYAGYTWGNGSAVEPENRWICKYWITESDDNGLTWSTAVTPDLPSDEFLYAISYSNGITLSQADGDGPKVDYVFTTGIMRNRADQSFATGAFYSKDGGKSWTFSKSLINYNYGDSAGHEGGMSEDTIWEKEDGTLIFYARCQITGVDHFAMSYSKDHGVTWSEITADTLTNFYTVNTQPIVESLNGTPVFMWGGNNTLGGRSYQRFPLNLAYSEDDGETFVGIIDASFQTTVAALERLHTNPDLTFHKYQGIDNAYIVSTSHEMFILNADDYLYKTRGGFDSFEDSVKAEGWLISRGTAISSEVGATDGERAMYVGANSHLTRSIHYIEEGTVEFDAYLVNAGEKFSIELQSAYNNIQGWYSSPLRLVSDSEGNLYSNGTEKTALGLKLNAGNNTVKIDFNGNEKTATITVNGKTADLEWVGNDNYVGFATIWTGENTGIAIDRLTFIRNDI